MMRLFFYVAIFQAFCFLNTSFGMEIDMTSIKTPKIIINNTKNLSGKFYTVYLLNGRKLLNSEPTVKIVFNVIETGVLSSGTTIVHQKDIQSNWDDNIFAPNYIQIVIHDEKNHALDKRPYIIGSFQPASFKNVSEVVAPTNTNKSFSAKISIEIDLSNMSEEKYIEL